MRRKPLKSDFVFRVSGHGRYLVTYTSPNTGNKWSAIIDDMTIIDATKYEEYPRRQDLEMLKWICKNKNVRL